MFDDALRGRRQALNLVLHLDVPNDVVMSRILDRWIHENSGRTYNMRFNPPKVEGKDDVTGEELVKRSDDDAVRTLTFRVLYLVRCADHSFRPLTGNLQGSARLVSSTDKAND